ncbi:peptide ABC transporter substrate-binding protein [Apilactobacillus timberlakei]|uniref:peptide ABC transporter substrate-binding protein n=1 Tax=Apilactobacillus timberlakei TaxID=2008380 RepID=UPI00112EB139|nr:peptide ABC transporter substrate-binding protein [Apilactobacillus timberlakei]TPR17388.1 peptide ABC transporter substrate-binding protein [Apilactobacillus timberlakei]TPR21630.1 peptide ABC transporter substrate-binding protein [Apilactobacillus timberlakei]TPR22876.1 peptide ABC transporter substrate-binding protein [Apilactobacillus timberlakei]TPR23880.1 peptide ABC transporter substrate-binding protein [Apilactobacillus timberlakei]
MKWKKSIVGMATAALALVLVACGSQNAQDKQISNKELNLSYPTEISSMDNTKASDASSLTMLYHTTEGLYRLGKNDSIDNALAKSYKVSNDGKQYTFNLRENAKWLNGKNVTANDFVYSWRRAADPKSASQYAYLFGQIRNYDAIQKGQMSPDSLGVKADGNYKLVVNLNKPVPYFRRLLSFPVFFPLQQSVVDKYGKSYGENSLKTNSDGPFILKKWNGTNENWQLVKNNKYWNAKNVHLQKINVSVVKNPSTSLNLFQQGKLDITPLNGDQVVNYKNSKGFKSFTGGATVYMLLNQKKNPILRNENARKALSMAINRDELSNNVLRDGSVPAKGLVPSKLANMKANNKGKTFGEQSYVKDAVSYNLDKSKSLWQKAMKEEKMSSVKLSLLTADDDQSKANAEFLQTQLNKLPGLSINVTSIPDKTRMSRQDNGQFDIAVNKWGADFSDPINFLQLFESNNSMNFSKWSNHDYDNYINMSNNRDANDSGKRFNDLVNAEKILMQNQGVIPLYQPATAELWNTHIDGYIWNPAGMSRNWININIK